MTDSIINQAVELIINTRDFCGDEREAVYEFAWENSIEAEREKLYRIANFRANARWNACQKAAGVNPKYTW